MASHAQKLVINVVDVPQAHIAGIVVHADNRQIEAIRHAVSILPGAEIHAVSPAGKLVVTLEAQESEDIIAQLNAIHALPGVYSASLIYQHHEDVESLDEETGDETDAPGVY
ncbi:chaperone NapD [Paraburkholderia gardini]|jgi:nitrate reductase NapD|uniref:Chaperone NapD n=1 Tax=Paraburkholderia gardini TaxID=2823469 RepID=A0ABN7QK97_9BURK|nr:chaperone NapD [Paraburkholderia gardini]CAG4902528.1 Chaperone NapD [Paraburkholderia gardini]CAG4903660.1 Chaperone NapD [Paraburkholderia gardini]